MSSLLELAATFEKQSKQQAANTSESVEAALKQHEQSLLSVLRSSESSLKSAISAHSGAVQTALQSSLKVSATVWLSGLIVAGAVLLALGWQIERQTTLLLEQRQTIGLLEARTGGATIRTWTEGSYLVLPKRRKLEAVTLESGETAIKLTR